VTQASGPLTCSWQSSIISLNSLTLKMTMNILGHSWCTILGCEHIISRAPRGMKHYVIADGFSSGKLWAEAAKNLIDELPPDVRDNIRKHDMIKTYVDPEFQEASMVFYRRHVCRA
jgi:L-proline amide hydrolase